MKAVISNFYTHKIGFFTNSLPVILFFLIYFTGCKVFSSVPSTDPSTAETELREKVASDANGLLGINYRYAGISPEKGFDCSGLTHYIFSKNGLELPHSSRSQIKDGVKISIKNAKPGDLVFFKRKGRVNHVAVVVENTDDNLIVIHSTNSQGVIKEDILNSTYWKKKIFKVKDVISQ